LIPSEHSSGQKVRRGAITRSGNPRLRRLMVESSVSVRAGLTVGR
jgi:transposase